MPDAPTGQVITIDPLIRRILAPNPSPFTYTGTQSHIVGSGAVAVIDPGPELASHIEVLLAATAGERIDAIVCTHTHRDHSPAARALQTATGAPIIGCAPLAPAGEGEADESFDADYRPDRVLADGERLEGEGWALEAVATPGHTSNHLCFALAGTGVFFSGDHVMGWSTSIVSPPDGDMGAYVASLEKLLGRPDKRYLPAHGDPVEAPHKLVRGMILHRRQREAQILARLADGARGVFDMVAVMYRGVDPRLHPAAARSVLAHLIDLERRGIAERDDERWQLRSQLKNRHETAT
ncbi:MAG TPA: MBL fold metallo-hydrolase [Allosphingosinicella sp.]|jgi:glyoxylase-like metal-dependent hydrolase (beta-lactamase superfamily II)|uniref:MBL fold metallo-hydrolase n=1 Tax=Allosphingosinicella sp. TaxID=2823234 RepID=UPI002F26EB49